MSRIKLSILLLSFGILTASCGFKPVHAKTNGEVNGMLASRLSSVQISDIPGREGQILKYKLVDLLQPDSRINNPEYRLDITIANTRNELGIQEDLRVTRYDIEEIANFKLISLANNQVALEGKSRIKSSFNRTASEFSTFVAEEDASEKAAEELAQELKQRLTAYFSK